MPRDSEPAECGNFEVERATKLALLVNDQCGTKVWVPRSEICDDSEIHDKSEIGDEGEPILPEWLAIEKGLV